MTEERIFRLESEVSNLREENATLAAAVKHLSEAVDGLSKSLVGLTSRMDRGAGALAVIVGLSVFVGGLISTVFSWFLNSRG